MKCALASLGFINEDIRYNQSKIINTLVDYSNKADVVIFGEAYLQGFYGVNFIPEHDSGIAIEKGSRIIKDICNAAKENTVAVSFGFLEKEKNRFYSSQITIDRSGMVIDLFRRVSPGWKERFAGELYCEGTRFHAFDFLGKRVAVGLCGDLWYEENIEAIKLLNPDVVWWPVYTDYHFNDWNTTIKYEYAAQAAKLGRPVLCVNSICMDKADELEAAKGGACCFADNRIVQEAAAGSENVLVVEL